MLSWTYNPFLGNIGKLLTNCRRSRLTPLSIETIIVVHMCRITYGFSKSLQSYSLRQLAFRYHSFMEMKYRNLKYSNRTLFLYNMINKAKKNLIFSRFISNVLFIRYQKRTGLKIDKFCDYSMFRISYGLSFFFFKLKKIW